MIFIKTVGALEPTFGGINLEDIKAPECFYIEETLREKMKIPVFHDDQHGTAIIASAAFLNACEVTGRDIAKTKVVFFWRRRCCHRLRPSFYQARRSQRKLDHVRFQGSAA